MTAFYGILLPFLGTVMGAGCVFFLKRSLGTQVQRALTGFAAGVMVAASIWSLLIPSYGQRCGDSCRSRFLAWHPVPADFG